MADETATVPDADTLLEQQAAAEVEVENPTVVQPVAVWLRSANGVAHNVNVGCEAYKQLIANGAQPTEPTDADREVTDYAMVEKAKADSAKPRR